MIRCSAFRPTVVGGLISHSKYAQTQLVMRSGSVMTCFRLKSVFKSCDTARWTVHSNNDRYVIKICVRLGKIATEIYRMLQEAFKDDCSLRTQAGRWCKARLKRRVARVRGDVKDSMKLHHDNAPKHPKVLNVVKHLAQNKISVVPQLPYSPDVVSVDFFLFPRSKKEFKGKQ